MNHNSIRSSLRMLKRYTLSGWLIYLYLKIMRKSITVEGHCNLCGRCCRRISLEINGNWLKDKREFDQLVKKSPEYSRFSIIGKDQLGFLLFSCSKHVKETGICADHDNRLDICVNYPERDLYFSGGEISKGCGYRFRQITPFSAVLKKELDAQNKNRPTSTGH